ncbi:ABC transporter permease subunit [Spiroplasma endosymbiont of Virgichneumon dumeticola]|uniref:ABC transporter permease subunit n=1 Tax=Spiroplasma endosymbiont of Virgichneumon dumeticola TaxID=3139323 RepID=UPI0035C89D3A
MVFSYSTVLINTILFACPLLLLCTGGILNTRAGIVNLGFDGIMCVGATFYCIIVSQLKSSMGSSVAILAFFVAIIVGMVFSLLHSLATLIFRANQFLVSMVINYLGYGLAVVLPLSFTGTINYSLSSIYIPLFPWPSFLVTLIVIYLFSALLFLTKLGLYIRGIGENPTAVALNYIHVRRSRMYISLISSSLACFAGAFFVYILPSSFIDTNNFNGIGFLVIPLWMMARSRFVLTTIICLIFSFIYQVGNATQSFSLISKNIPSWLWGMLPYLIALGALMIFRPDTMLPPSWGVPYVKTGRRWQ